MPVVLPRYSPRLAIRRLPALRAEADEIQRQMNLLTEWIEDRDTQMKTAKAALLALLDQPMPTDPEAVKAFIKRRDTLTWEHEMAFKAFKHFIEVKIADFEIYREKTNFIFALENDLLRSHGILV